MTSEPYFSSSPGHSGVTVHAVGRPDVPPCPMPGRFRTDIAYFKSAPPGVARPPEGEFIFDPASVKEWLESGVLLLVSPLDAAHATEVEITEDQERFIRWLHDHAIQRVRLS